MDSEPPLSPARSRPVRLRGRGSTARGVKGFGVRDPPNDPPAAGSPSCGSCGRHRTRTCAVEQQLSEVTVGVSQTSTGTLPHDMALRGSPTSLDALTWGQTG